MCAYFSRLNQLISDVLSYKSICSVSFWYFSSFLSCSVAKNSQITCLQQTLRFETKRFFYFFFLNVRLYLQRRKTGRVVALQSPTSCRGKKKKKPNPKTQQSLLHTVSSTFPLCAGKKKSISWRSPAQPPPTS